MAGNAGADSVEIEMKSPGRINWPVGTPLRDRSGVQIGETVSEPDSLGKVRVKVTAEAAAQLELPAPAKLSIMFDRK